ncbi:MAG: hypothetical protein EDM05_037435 [Leptolyngbya sp. IPPAS B-1204]|nr:hypothetical protein [Elainella sp. C42_A2020_010]RNJ68934.1 MAG: hypothetical protein EDM05_11955 [Leptolyngbya sp. IPPAS B-1204]
MSPTMMRQFWSLVEGIRANIPVALDDNSLEQWLLRQLRSEQALNHRDTAIFSNYIHSRLPLIRELVQEC